MVISIMDNFLKANFKVKVLISGKMVVNTLDNSSTAKDREKVNGNPIMGINLKGNT